MANLISFTVTHKKRHDRQVYDKSKPVIDFKYVNEKQSQVA